MCLWGVYVEGDDTDAYVKITESNVKTTGVDYRNRLQISANTSTSRTQIAVSRIKGGLGALLGTGATTMLIGG